MTLCACDPDAWVLSMFEALSTDTVIDELIWEAVYGRLPSFFKFRYTVVNSKLFDKLDS